MQVVLQATHGVVSGAPEFFRCAFGGSYEEFENILYRPHHFIFNRFWYEQHGGRAELDEYLSLFNKLSVSQKSELLEYLCKHDKHSIGKNLHTIDASIAKIARFYIPMAKDEEAKIWDAQREARKNNLKAYMVPKEELVEDADLTNGDYISNVIKPAVKRSNTIEAVA